jgi:hypothetical protein
MFMARGGPRLRSDSSSPSLIPRYLRALLLVALSLAVAACSMVRIGYTYADTFVLNSLDEYLELSDEQEVFVRRRIDPLLAWHRSTQLRDYAIFIENTRARLGGPVAADDVVALNLELNSKLLALGDHLAPDLAQLARSLKPDQIDRLEKRFEESVSKARQSLVKTGGREYVDGRVQKVTQRAEYWFGTLNRAQLDAVRSSLVSRPASDEWWITERGRRLRDLVTLLRRIQTEQPSEAVATRWIRAYFAQLTLPLEPERRAQLDAYRRGNAEMIAELVNRATAEQRAALDRKLASFAQDFVALARQSGRG